MADNVDLMRRFVKEVQQDGDFSKIADFVEPDMVDHDAEHGPQGIERAKMVLGALHTIMTDITVTIEHCISSGDTIATNKVLRGKLVRDWVGVEGKGQIVERRIMDWVILSPNRKFAHHWANLGPVVEVK